MSIGTGPGLDADIIDHIFEPFFTTKETGKGTGLGLSVVYGIVEQHKGWMEVESGPGRGALFKVFIPALPGRLHSEPAVSFSLDFLHGNGERILVVEDDETLRRLATIALQKSGYVVWAAENGQQAQALFEERQGDFDLIFCDVVLPDINGLQLTDSFVGLKPALKILLSSGYADAKARRSGIADRHYPFIGKPYTINSLLRKIKELVSAGC